MRRCVALAATRAEVSKARSSSVGLFHSFRGCGTEEWKKRRE